MLLPLCLAAGCGFVVPKLAPTWAPQRAPLRQRAPATVARQSFAAGQLLLPFAASVLTGVLGLEAVRQLNEGSALKDLIKKYTSIIVVDSPEGMPSTPPTDGVYWYIKDPDVYRRVLVQGDLGLGESYMDGQWESNDLEGFVFEMLKLEVVKKDLGLLGLPLLSSAIVGSVSWLLFPTNLSASGAKENIAKHYDISMKLYEQMLGPTMMYSGAYYHTPEMTLEEAQIAKMRLVADKLDLKPGMKVLELGCGFGALADLMATEYGVHVTGVTLSEDQHAYAKKHFKNPMVDIRLQDYRSMTGQFDRIYSVGIFEHIGRNCYETYFEKCQELLKDDGIMVIHTIGFCRSGQWNHGGWMNTYIFPGAELPTMSHFTQGFQERWHLEDWQSFGVSYAKTLRAWKDNLDNWKGLEEFDLRFRRMWEYYLMCCAASFQARRTKLWQLVYTKYPSKRQDDCHHIRQPKRAEPATATRWNREIT